MRSRRNTDDVEFGGMTSFVDVVFSLLIFFVVTARFIPPEMRLPLFLSEPGKSVFRDINSSTLTVRLTSDQNNGAKVYIGDGATYFVIDGELEDIKEHLINFRDDNLDVNGKLNENTKVVIQIDEHVVWQNVITIMDVARAQKLPISMSRDK